MGVPGKVLGHVRTACVLEHIAVVVGLHSAQHEARRVQNGHSGKYSVNCVSVHVCLRASGARTSIIDFIFNIFNRKSTKIYKNTVQSDFFVI